MSTAPVLWSFDAEDAAPRLFSSPAGEVALISRRGPGKQINEDAALVMPLGDRLVIAVADGMGGQPDGDQAARLTIEALAKRLTAPDAVTATRAAVVEGFELANETVLARTGGAGATLVAAVIGDGKVRVLHAGDSEAMLVGQRGRVKLRTVAHSPTGYALHSGFMGEQEAMVHEDRHVVSNAIGMTSMSIEVGPKIDLARRDTLILASDGLFDNLTEDEVTELIRTGSLAAAAQKAADGARARMADGRDPATPSKPDDLTLVLFRPLRPQPHSTNGA